MTTTDRPVRYLGARTTGLGGEVFLTRGNDTYVLGEIEVVIWRLCDGRSTAADIAERLTRDYQVELPEALADTTEFLRQLADAGLLEAA